jgi:two-component system, chemotaxis family, chemotaxis protein CheY
MIASQHEFVSSPREVTILLVDDDVRYKAVFQHVIKELGRRTLVYAVYSGREALDFLQERMVDIIVLDYEMPDMKGTDVLAHLKGQGITKTAVGLTRHDKPEILSSMVDACALKAFCKTNRQEWSAFLSRRIDDLCVDT